MKRIYLILLGLLVSFPILGQEMNSYQYVIVPKKFEFTKEADMYQVNSLTEFLFHKYGFDAFLEGEELPEEIMKDKCKALYADVEENSGLFVTRLNVILKDCQNKKIFVSEEGTSRFKDYKMAYHEALRKAFESIGKLNYKYVPGSVISSEAKTNKDSAEAVLEKKTVVVTAIPQVPVDEIPSVEDSSEPTSTSEEIILTRDGLSFSLRKSGEGFDLYQNGMMEPFASLVPSKNSNSFIYSSVKDQGIANFNEAGDLVVEIFERETNSTQTRTYKRSK